MTDAADNNGSNGNGSAPENGQEQSPAVDLSSAEIGHGRDARGQFVPGNKCGKGNPYLRRIAEYRQAIYKVLTPRALEGIMGILVRLALEKKDLAAIKLVLEYSIGKPERYDPTSGEDVAEQAAAIRDFLRRAKETIRADEN